MTFFKASIQNAGLIAIWRCNKKNALEKQAWDKGESLGKSSEPYKELKIEKENPELY